MKISFDKQQIDFLESNLDYEKQLFSFLKEHFSLRESNLYSWYEYGDPLKTINNSYLKIVWEKEKIETLEIEIVPYTKLEGDIGNYLSFDDRKKEYELDFINSIYFFPFKNVNEGMFQYNHIILPLPVENNLNKIFEEFYILTNSFVTKNLIKTETLIKNSINKFKVNEKGEIIFLNNDFSNLLKDKQNQIIDFDIKYVHSFIKISNYIDQKKTNIQSIYNQLGNIKNKSQLENILELIDQEIHTYNLIQLNSLFMINSLIERDLITFYELYEKFDKLNIFNSNWENELSDKISSIQQNLKEINSNLHLIIDEIRNVGDRIVSSIDNLSYITEESTRQLTSKMEEIDSTLKVGNLINVIQTYQMYKVNKNTKSLRG